MEPTDILEANRSAVRRATGRVAELVRSLTDPHQALPGLDWSARDVPAHLVTGFDLYVDIAAGTPSPVPALDRTTIAAENAKRIADIPETDPAKLAGLLEDAADRFLASVEGRVGTQEVVFHAGIRLDLASLLGVLLGELLLHGYDLARLLHRPWPLDQADAALVLAGYAPCYGATANRERTRRLTAAFDVELRGVASFVVRFDDGDYSVEPSGSEAVDATISADPVAFLLVSSGRLDRWPAMTLRLVEVGGADPPLGVRFFDLFVYP